MMFRLFATVGIAALIVTGGCFLLVLVAMLAGSELQLRAWQEVLLEAVAVAIPVGTATWGLSQRVKSLYPPRQGRAVSTAFGIFTPISLLIALAVSPLAGSFIGALLATAVLTALLNFVVCMLVLRVTRLAIDVERSDEGRIS